MIHAKSISICIPQRKKTLKLIHTINMKKTTTFITSALCAAATSVHATTIFSENFDALTTSSAVSGQGGWGGPTGPCTAIFQDARTYSGQTYRAR